MVPIGLEMPDSSRFNQYFLNQNYSTAINLTSRLKESRHIKIAYEATFLEFKAFYMQGDRNFNILKMLFVVLRKSAWSKLFLIGFFLLHYGIFWTGHGLLLWSLFRGRLRRVTSRTDQL